MSLPGIDQFELDRLSERAQAIYDQCLRAVLEPEQNGQTVAIHVDSGDHAVARNSPSALRAIRVRRPHGMVVTMTIGPEKQDPTLDRILASQLRAGQRK